MKISLLFLFLLFSITVIAQNIRVYNQYVDTEDVSAYAKTFKDFNEKFKRKSGAIGLQRVQFLNEVTTTFKNYNFYEVVRDESRQKIIIIYEQTDPEELDKFKLYIF